MAYTGEQATEFANAVTTINEVSVDLFKEILATTGTAYTGVKDTFPRVYTANLIESAVTQTIKNKEIAIIQKSERIVTVCEFFNSLDVDVEKANRAEKSALDNYEIVKPYVEILKQRLLVNNEFIKTENAFWR